MKVTMFYQELKEIRESKNITVEQIANKTKINIKILQSFEEGDFTALTPMYVRLFLRAYTREIGENSDEYLAKYQEFITKGTDNNSKNNRKKDTTKNTQHIINPETMGDRQKIILLSLSVIIIIFLVIILKQIFNDTEKSQTKSIPVSSQQFADEEINNNNNTESASNDNQADISEAPDNQQINNETEVITEQEENIQESQNLTLVMETRDSCWIKIIIDRADTSEGIFLPERTQEWIALENFDLRVGKPSAVSLFLNGKKLDYGTTDNVTSRLLITKDGIINR